jgi:hypothetical protein
LLSLLAQRCGTILLQTNKINPDPFLQVHLK